MGFFIMNFLNKLLSKVKVNKQPVEIKIEEIKKSEKIEELKVQKEEVKVEQKTEKQQKNILDILTPVLLKSMIEPHHKLPTKRAETVFAGLLNAMREGKIDNKLRVSAFIAQVAHESGAFRYMEEIASGEAYEGRKNLGNTQPGDGKKFKGRGYIQLTGRTNYTKAAKDLSLPLIEKPELAATYDNAPRIAVWFWNSRKLNDLADRKEFDKITKLINGGFNGKADRDAIYENCLKVLEKL